MYVHIFSFHWQPVRTQRFLAPSAPLSCFPLPWVVTLELLGTEGRWFLLSVMVVFQGVCPYSPRSALRVGERQSWVKCLVQEHNVSAAGSNGSSLPTQSHFTATPGDQAFEPPSGFESPILSITSSACYHLRHSASPPSALNISLVIGLIYRHRQLPYYCAFQSVNIKNLELG